MTGIERRSNVSYLGFIIDTHQISSSITHSNDTMSTEFN